MKRGMPSLLAIVAALNITGAMGVVHRVPGDYLTIQDGIDAASVGDTVLVADGIYWGPGNYDLNFLGKDLVCRSENGPEHTIIDAYPGRGFRLGNGETEASVIEGFTITRGWTELPGAGIYLTGVSTRIINCLIVGNEAGGTGAARGGGIACGGGCQSALIRCTITGNVSFPDQGPCPGGLYCYNSTVVLDRCAFWDNHMEDIRLEGASTATVVCCCVDPEKLYVDGEGEFVFEGENVFTDPLFCDPQPYVPPWEADPADPEDYKLWNDSPCLPGVSPCGALIGALPIGCPASSVPPETRLVGSVTPLARLESICPNPSSGVTSLVLNMQQADMVHIAVLDAAGRIVKRLPSQRLTAGRHEISLDLWGAGLHRNRHGVCCVRVWGAGWQASKAVLTLR